MRVPRLGIDHADHPVGGDPPGDPPPPVRVVAALGGFDVLAGDQGQQRHRLRLSRAQLLVGQVTEQPVRIGHQRVDQLRAGLLVVPGDRRLARIVVVMSGAAGGDHLRRARHLPTDPADRRDQLGDRVLGSHRVIKHRGVQRPPGPAPQRPGGGDDLPDRVEDPVRPARGGQPTAPVRQRRRVEALIGQRQPAGHLPPQITPQRLDRLPVRQPVQGLQHDHRSGHIRRHTRPTGRRAEQVREHHIREQLPAMLGQEREHAANRHQMPHQCLRV